MTIVIDFNSAQSQDCFDCLDSESRLDRLRRETENNAKAIIQHLLPGGSYYAKAQEYEAGDLQGNPGQSLKISLKPDKFGVWTDFATGEKGGDLIDLWKQSRKCTFPEAVLQIEEFLSLTSDRRATLTMPPSEPGNGRSPVKWESETRQKKTADLGKPTHTWHYRDPDGCVIASVTRYDPEPGKKEFRPWDALNKKHQHPEIRPLYNQPGIIKSSRVVLVEGEKCADALIGIGVCATTAMGGANAPAEKTDWSILVGKEVLIWPDNDQPGKVYADTALRALSPIAKSVRILNVPAGVPDKWDAADAVVGGFDIQTFLDGGPQQSGKHYKVRLSDWTLDAYQGSSPDRQWLVEHLFPMGALSILAASGGTGKGMLGLHLALQVICDHEADLLNPHPKAFGNNVVRHGSAVIFSAEDDRDEIHRRLEQLDPESRRDQSVHKLIVVPLPNAGGPSPLVVPGKNGPEVTAFYHEIREQLIAIQDLALVIFDPLSSFAMVDLVKNPTDCVFVNGVLASLAADTKAAIIACHHLNKLRSDKPIMSPDQAREMISGSARVIDGVRLGYCIWPMDREGASRKCKKIGFEYRHDLVFAGCPVKANLPVDKEIKVFFRDDRGLLVVMNEALKAVRINEDDRMDALVSIIARGARAGRPFTQHGKDTCFNSRRDELPDELKDVGKNRLSAMSDQLLEDGLVKKCVAQGSKSAVWLDVPGGPFFDGIGKFEPGFVEI